MAGSPRVGPRVRNRIGWRHRLARLGGSPVEHDLRVFDEPLADIARLEDETADLSDERITRRAAELRAGAEAGLALDALQAPLFALVREAAGRTLGLRPFDVQVVAALALGRGRVVEMQTGEGKTLAAVMPAALHALAGAGVHVLTFNDYLAQRDAEWMGPVYRMLGLSVDAVQQGMTPAARRRAYRADVTYVTAREAGFDYLRDLRATDPDDVVHRPFHMALVDEVDSLLIDEARVPLVVAGQAEQRDSRARRLAEIVAALAAGVDFDTDEYGRSVELTETGLARLERVLSVPSLHDPGHCALLTGINCALHARVLLRRDVDYLVRDGRIAMIDEFTGRVVPDRHWPDGLQAALEAKEGIAPDADGRILGSMPLQHFLRSYPFLCGMTGTAQNAAHELQELYELRTVVVPTHRPMVRIDRPDVVFTHREAKEHALVEEIRRVHARRRPVLVGTLTVAESERLAARLRAAGVACAVLNARNDAAEARVVARAGRLDAVTISTNMAGRGTDIRLGGADETERDQVVALGGLYVIGTNRHESRRVDLQLRGRAGRQGDPGESRLCCIRNDDDTGRVAHTAPAGEGHEPGRGTRCSGAAGGVQRPRGRREAPRRVPARTRSVRHPRAQQYGGQPHQQQLLRVGDPADERRVLRRNPRRDADEATARPDPHVDEGGADRRDRPGVGRRGVHGARVDRRHPQSRGRPPAGCERVEPARAAMTTRPRTKDLTLPEPARTLLSRTRAILDRLRHAANAGRSGWIIGGGTILAARWRHRESRDIDLLVHPRTETRFPATGGRAGIAPPA